MKTERKLLIAFLMNLSFSLVEFLGGILTGSAAIASDALHDLGDAVGIGIACLLERKSRRPPDERYTYGYARYSVLGGFLTGVILLVGSVLMIFHAVGKIRSPQEIDCGGMIVFALVGVCVNFLAVLFTRRGSSVNQKAVNLHMLEDVLGWAVVLLGALVMRFTGFSLLDPLLSMGVSLFILVQALKSLKEIAELFLVKVPDGLAAAELQAQLQGIVGVLDVHHLHIWSMDGQSHFATVHVVSDGEAWKIKQEVRQLLHSHGIGHVTVELESGTEHCSERQCSVGSGPRAGHGHHHHHHHRHRHGGHSRPSPS